jgi:hypothetical protein
MLRTKRTVILLGFYFLSAAAAWAHHAFSAEFDANKRVMLQGKVTRLEWINPHSWIHMDVKGADGKISTWRIEGGSPNALISQGVTKSLLTIGMEIVVDGYQAKNGTNTANGRDITLADGRKLSLSSSNTAADDKSQK